MTYEIIRLDLWMGHGLDFVILFFYIIVCFFTFFKTQWINDFFDTR